MKVIYLLAMLLMVQKSQAQLQQGRVVYELTRQMQVRVSDNSGTQQQLPRTHVIKVEVLFGNNQMLRRQLEDDNLNDFGSNDGMQVRNFIIGGDDDITWINFTEARKVEQREFATKQYLINDSIRKLNWKLTGETKTILGYACQQAVTTQIGNRMMMTMENGSFVRKEVPDTSNILAWFTPAIPVAAGPDFQGQLPGLILEINVNGKSTYKAIEVSPKANMAIIKEPKSGKKVTADEFNKERDKAMDEMQRNGGFMIRRRN
jgi:GLPGLI family protein